VSLVVLGSGPEPFEQGPTPAVGSDFERLGPTRLRVVIDRFLDKVFGDVMIGFMFDHKPKARIRELEYRFAAAHLGATSPYGGRPLEEAHTPLRIFDGQFARRRHLLAETLTELSVPDDIAARWLQHTDSLRERILAGSCQ
jgi:truncated hemoglobin YjbI